MMNPTQKQIWDEFSSIELEINRLKSYVQNDFQMIQDKGWATRSEITEDCNNCLEGIAAVSNRLRHLQLKLYNYAHANYGEPNV